MIISKTPFRISFAGGGTDFKKYFNQKVSVIISSTIDKYIYVTVNKRFDGKIHLRYSEIEEVNHLNDLRHDMVREALKLLGIKSGIEIVTIADIPTKGSGLGSSSAFAVGLLNALYAYKNCILRTEELARLACSLEIDVLKSPIGYQDQYASAMGGFNIYKFDSDHCYVTPVPQMGLYNKIKQLEDNTLLFYLGNTRSANNILKTHSDNLESNIELLDQLQDLSLSMTDWLSNENSVTDVGFILNSSWEIKKKMSNCSNEYIDRVVRKTLDSGAQGVKLCGAGGGGFMLVYCPLNSQERLRLALYDLHELKFKFSYEGSKIIYNDQLH